MWGGQESFLKNSHNNNSNAIILRNFMIFFKIINIKCFYVVLLVLTFVESNFLEV